VINHGHRDTWRLWLDIITKLDGETAEAVAEALSFAAPDGPLGVPCVDECHCHDGVPSSLAAQLYVELTEREIYKLSDGDRAVRKLREALTVDMITHTRRPVVSIRNLARVDVIVSQQNGDVAHARRLLPRTWAEISAAAEEAKRR